MRGVGKNTVSQVLSGIVAIEGYLQFERAVSLLNSLFLFPVATALYKGIVSTNRRRGLNIPPLRLFKM